MIVESGEQSGLYLIQRGTVRKQIKLATIVVFVSLPGEKEQTLYIVLTKAQEFLEPFYIGDSKLNLQKLAKEYKKLQKYKYIFGLETGEKIELQFSDRDFYHLLGFQKFKNDVTIVKMIEDQAYYKDNFYRNVLGGYITYDKITIPIKNIETYFQNGKVVHFDEATVNDSVKLVIENRFPYFTYDNIRMLMSSDIIVLYDKSKANPWNKIDADKIFFQLLAKEGKNLNFFIKKSENTEQECPVSFFLEKEKDAYITTRHDCEQREQAKAEITFRAVIRKETQNIEEFQVDWDKVRFFYSKNNLIEYKAHKKLAEYFPYGTLIDHNAAHKIYNEKVKERDELIKELNKVQKDLDLIMQYEHYVSEVEEEKKLEVALEILDKYGINVEEVVLDLNTKQLSDEETLLKGRLSKCNRNIKKIEKQIPVIYELEKQEIVYVYKNFIANIEKYNDTFFCSLIDVYDVMHKSFSPKEIEKYFDEFVKENRGKK